MQRNDGLLCDRATVQLAGRALAWSDAGPAVLKGFPQPLEVARLEGLRRQCAAEAAPAPASLQLRLIGRAHEQARIDASLSAHVAGRSSEEGRILLIEAEAGMGKSVLARFALSRAQDMRLPALLVPASHIERFTAYYVWRPLLQRMLIPDESTPGPARLTKAILDLLACTPKLLEFAPLLRDILPVEIEATELTRQMESSARATMTARLLVHLLENGGAGPLLIV